MTKYLAGLCKISFCPKFMVKIGRAIGARWRRHHDDTWAIVAEFWTHGRWWKLSMLLKHPWGMHNSAHCSIRQSNKHLLACGPEMPRVDLRSIVDDIVLGHDVDMSGTDPQRPTRHRQNNFWPLPVCGWRPPRSRQWTHLIILIKVSPFAWDALSFSLKSKALRGATRFEVFWVGKR